MNLLDAFDSAVRKTPAKAVLRVRGASISSPAIPPTLPRAASSACRSGTLPYPEFELSSLICLST